MRWLEASGKRITSDGIAKAISQEECSRLWVRTPLGMCTIAFSGG